MYSFNVIANLRTPSRSRFLFGFLVVLLVLTSVPFSGVATARQSENEIPTDLAAMVLRPSDFDAEGFPMTGDVRVTGLNWNYLPTGSMVLPEAVQHSVVAGTPDHLRSQLFLDLEEAGWQQQFRSVISPSTEGDLLFVSTIGEYADENGAEDAFQLLTNTDDVRGAWEIDDIAQIGDESAAHRDELGRLTTNGERITVTFRFENFIGTLEVHVLDSVELDLIEALAERMIERIELVLDGELGGPSHLALRLNIAVSPFIERYDLLDNDFLPMWYETEEERIEIAANFESRIHSFRLDQAIPMGGRELHEVPRYAVIITEFDDEDAASDFLAEIPGRREMEPLDDVAEFGDESLTFLEEFVWLDLDRFGFRTFIRVGAFIANMVIDGTESPTLATLEALAELQTDCLEAEACPDAAPIPDELLDFVCETGPVEEADDSLGEEIETDMPMAGGDAAQTGEQPGPGPDGDPELLWRFEGAGGFQVAPVVADGMIYLGSGYGDATAADGNLYALDATTGERGWCIPTGGSFYGSQVFADGLIIGAQDDPRVWDGTSAIVALDAETGESVWSTFVPNSTGDLIIQDDIVFTRGGGALTALDLDTGEIRWQFAPDGDEEAAFFSMAIADGVVYAHHWLRLEQPEILYALEAATGDEIWTLEIDKEQSVTGGPAVADGLVFLGTSAGDLLALNAETGDEEWRFAPELEAWEDIDDDTGPTFYAPAVVDGVVYAGTGSTYDEVEGDGYLFAIDAESGDELWRYESVDPINMRPALADGVVYAGDVTGLLHAVDIESGDAIWTFELDGALGQESPTILDGVLFITDTDGSLYAIAGSDR